MEPAPLYPKGNGILCPTKLLTKCVGTLKVFLDIRDLNELLELLHNNKRIESNKGKLWDSGDSEYNSES